MILEPAQCLMSKNIFIARKLLSPEKLRINCICVDLEINYKEL